ncbi:tetratricopeptide repeat protein [Opitutus sp. ER46]|uniref:tetratricopeptide repeat protein n=1 Tax=Opitutus sp. ER46 TaxID=2161864 RepID=UPI000D30E6E0|nr:tetratricopeptide repeat protein [Opitutus sp. ER46]PTY00339.1 hypothetical protein DB354_01645 [Opitutus sp. ER46]
MAESSELLGRAPEPVPPHVVEPRPVFVPDPEAPWRRWFAALLIVAAIGLAYANSFPGAFFFDDDAAILQNTSLRDLGNWRRVLWPPVEAGIGGRPLGNLTFALNYALGGYSPAGFHAVNLAIHVAAALALFLLTRHTLRRPRLAPRFAALATPLAVVVALLWALHPVQTNVVDYASQRTEGLMAALYVFCLYAFARGLESGSRGWTTLAVAGAALGMATKENMVTVPLLALLYDRTFVAGSFGAAVRRHGWRHLALASTWLLLAGLMAYSRLNARGVGFGIGRSASDYALTEIRAVAQYLQVAAWPHPLVFDYGTNFYVGDFAAVWPQALLLFLALIATMWALVRRPAAGFAAAWFFLTLAPSSSIVPVVQQPCAENRLYLPLAGLAAFVAIAGTRALGRRGPLLFGAAAAALGLATVARNPVFASELAVWTNTVAVNPGNARAANNLANALLKRGRNEEAMVHIERAIAISPNYADAHNNRGVVFLRRGQLQEAITEFRAAMRNKANYADAHYNLGQAYVQLHQPAEAIAALRESLRLHPGNPRALNNLGIALLDAGRVDESLTVLRQTLAIDPAMPEAHYNLGNSLARAGQPEAALAAYDRALAHDPKFAKAHNNAGVVLLRLGRPAEAADRFAAALQIKPEYPEARRNLELVRPSAHH